MKVIDLQLYRAQREIKKLQDKVGELAMFPSTGNMNQLKLCFKEWLSKAR